MTQPTVSEVAKAISAAAARAEKVQQAARETADQIAAGRAKAAAK